MNENDYLDAMNQLKKKFDENEKKVEIFIKENIKLKKHIMVLYGLCKMCDMLDSSSDVMEREFCYSQMRGYLSDVIEQDLLSCYNTCGQVMQLVDLDEIETS